MLAYKKQLQNAQIAHLVFAYTLANQEKPKELFFANAQKDYRNERIDK